MQVTSSTFNFSNNYKFVEDIQNEGHRPMSKPDKVCWVLCELNWEMTVLLLHKLHKSFSYLWSLQWYMEFIQVLTKVKNTTLFSFSRHFLLILIQSYMNEDLVLDFIFKIKWILSWTYWFYIINIIFSSLYEKYFFVMNAFTVSTFLGLQLNHLKRCPTFLEQINMLGLGFS